MRIQTFEICDPIPGLYAPWPDPEHPAIGWEMELITITNTHFSYSFLTDATPDITNSGPVQLFKDHIYLDNPAVWEPYRVSGVADGAPVLLKRGGYEQWKKTKRLPASTILYLQRGMREKVNRRIEPMTRSAVRPVLESNVSDALLVTAHPHR